MSMRYAYQVCDLILAEPILALFNSMARVLENSVIYKPPFTPVVMSEGIVVSSSVA